MILFAVSLRVSYFILLFGFSWVYVAAQQSAAPAPRDPSPALKVAVNSVLVPVAVRDSHGNTVGDLEQQDFQVLDGKKPQVISGFSILKRDDVLPPAGATATSPNLGVNSSRTVAPRRFVVFLFDDLHFGPGDLLRVQQVAGKAIAESLTASDMAAVVSFSGSNSGLTSNRAALQKAVSDLRMLGLFRHVGRDCPDIDYYQGDLIENKHEQVAFEAAVEETMTCAHTDLRSAAESMVQAGAIRALAIGDQDVRVTLGFIASIVKKMAALPGERKLILISPGFLTVTAEALHEKSQILDLAAHANVSISTLDGRGLYSTEIDASEIGANTASDLVTGRQSEYHRNTATQSEAVLAELADGTGGTFFHNDNDLAGGVKALTMTPEFVYILELSLANIKRDGNYHPLQVRVDRAGVKVKARHGYFAPEPPHKKAK